MERSEAGIGLVEVLISTVMLMILGAAIVSNLHMSLRSAKYIEIQHAASTIAADKIEQIAAKDVTSINSTLNESETPVSWYGLNLQFKRSTNVVENSSGSKTVTVSVKADGSNMPKAVVFEDEFYAW